MGLWEYASRIVSSSSFRFLFISLLPVYPRGKLYHRYLSIIYGIGFLFVRAVLGGVYGVFWLAFLHRQ
jgi:hypothetical protein